MEKNRYGTCMYPLYSSHDMWILYVYIYIDVYLYMFYIHISRPKQVHVPGGFWPFGKDEPRVIDASLAQLCHTGVDSKVFRLRFPRLWIPLKFNKKHLAEYIYILCEYVTSIIMCLVPLNARLQLKSSSWQGMLPIDATSWGGLQLIVKICSFLRMLDGSTSL